MLLTAKHWRATGKNMHTLATKMTLRGPQRSTSEPVMALPKAMPK